MSSRNPSPDSQLARASCHHAELFDLIERLRGNCIPTSSEVNQISELILEAKSQIDEYNSDILKLMDSISGLEERRSNVAKRISGYRSLLAPIRRLPPEVLSRIFVESAECVVDLESSTSRLVMQGIRLKHVCFHWYQLSSGLSDLWVKLTVIHTSSNGQIWRRDDAYWGLNVLFRLSRERLLSIIFEANFSISSPFHDLIIMESMRWRSLELRLRDQLHPDVLSPIRGKIPLLESLNLTSREVPLVPGVVDAFELAPRLRDLTLKFVPPASLTLPWNQITTFTGIRMSLSNTLEVLGKCTSIKEFSIVDPFSKKPLGDISMTTSSVTSLAFVWSGSAVRHSDLKRFFPTVNLPSLDALAFSSDFSETAGTFPAKDFLDFLSRSSCTLTRLQIASLDIRGLLPILRSLSSLVYLTIHEPDLDFRMDIPEEDEDVDPAISRALIEQMNTSLTPEPLLPCLTQLEITVNKDSSFSDEAFLSMIQSRWHPLPESNASVAQCIRRARLSLPRRRFNASLCSAVETLRIEGLNIHISDSEQQPSLRVMKKVGRVDLR